MNKSHTKFKKEIANYVKIVIELSNADWHRYTTESLWATHIGKDIFRIENIPFCAYEVSYGDLVKARFSNGVTFFDEVHERGGHSTYRIFLERNCDPNEFEKAWFPLANLGCSYEKATKRLIAVDIPPEANIYQAYKLLEEGLQNKVWDFEEAHCGHPLA